jgi:hypothetical protein
MRHLRAVVFLLILCLPGCRAPERSAETPSPPATAMASAPGSEAQGGDALVNRVWVRADPGGPPGELRIFLSDGTLVQDSCGEVYALRTWRRVSADDIVFVEDVEIPARIVALNQDELRLSLSLMDGTRQEVSYKRAQVPYICPDLKSKGAS